MRCDIKIMAAPKRRKHVQDMCRDLRLDEEKDVFFDDRGNPDGVMYTARKTWSLPFEPGVTHRCVLQDDVTTSKNFKLAIQSIVKAYPNNIFTLYCSRASLADAKSHYVNIGGCGVWGQAVIIPKKYIQDVFSWVDSINPDYPHDDTAIGEFARTHGIRVFTTKPNLVQHLSPTDSLIGYNDRRKVSKCFYSGDALMLDWSREKNIDSIYAPNSVKVK